MRIIGWFFIVLAAVALGLDIAAWAYDGESFELRPLGVIWNSIDGESLRLVQPAVERHLDWTEDKTIYGDFVRPVLLARAVLLFGGVGVAFLALAWLLSPLRRARI